MVEVNLIVTRSVRENIVGAVNDIVKEALIYVFYAPRKHKGFSSKSSLHRHFTQGNIKLFNPYFVPNTPENKNIIRIGRLTDSLGIRASQRGNMVYIKMDLLGVGHLSWRYKIEEVDKGKMSRHTELRFDKTTKEYLVRWLR